MGNTTLQNWEEARCGCFNNQTNKHDLQNAKCASCLRLCKIFTFNEETACSAQSGDWPMRLTYRVRAPPIMRVPPLAELHQETPQHVANLLSQANNISFHSSSSLNGCNARQSKIKTTNSSFTKMTQTKSVLLCTLAARNTRRRKHYLPFSFSLSVLSTA